VAHEGFIWTRRGFLGGLLGLAAAPLVQPVEKKIFVVPANYGALPVYLTTGSFSAILKEVYAGPGIQDLIYKENKLLKAIEAREEALMATGERLMTGWWVKT
jgi:hypothetical protein